MKSDVYSFGVLLLQMISGKRTMCLYGPNKNLNLLEYVSQQPELVLKASVLQDSCWKRYFAHFNDSPLLHTLLASDLICTHFKLELQIIDEELQNLYFLLCHFLTFLISFLEGI